MRVEQEKKEIPSLKDFVPSQPGHKVLTLFGLMVVSTAVFWLAWNNALHNVAFTFSLNNILTVVSTLLAFCLMFAMVALTEVLVTKRLMILLTIIVAALTSFVFFGFSVWTLIAALIMMLGFLLWRRSINDDLKTRTTFKPQKTLDAGLKGAVTIILLASSVMYYGYFIDQPNAEDRIVNGLVDTSMSTVNFTLENVYGNGYDKDLSLDAFIANITRIDQLKSQGVDEIDNVTPEIRALDEQIKAGLDAASNEIVAQGRQEFLNTFDIQAAGSDTMDAVVRKIVTKKVNQFVQPYQKFIPALLALSLFFVLNVFSIVYRELIKAFSLLVYQILRWLHFIKITKVQTEVEKVTL